MSDFKAFVRSGHWPTLLASFLYFDFTFAIWVLNGAMAPFISETFKLDAAQKGFLVSVPIIAGALMRFPLGVLAQYIGRKNAALVEMGLIVLGLLYGFLYVDTHDEVLAMGVLLGIAGVGLLLALLFVSVFVGIAMLAVGMLWRLWKRRGKPIAARSRRIDGHHLEGRFRVMERAQLPLSR
jgi:nitrate/nitrite transporter NarK